MVVAFSVKTPRSVEMAAAQNQVPIYSSPIIYEIMDEIRNRVIAMLPTTIEKKVTGEATVLQPKVIERVENPGAVSLIHLKDGPAAGVLTVEVRPRTTMEGGAIDVLRGSNRQVGPRPGAGIAAGEGMDYGISLRLCGGSAKNCH